MGDPWRIGGFRGGGEKPNIKQIVSKIGEIWKNWIFLFLLKMVSNALGTPRNTFKSQKLA